MSFVTSVELFVGIVGILLVGVGITLKIFWEAMTSTKQDNKLALDTMGKTIDDHQDRLIKMESFMDTGFREIRDLQHKNLQASTEASSKLTVAITKINATLEYVIKRQEKHEEEIDKLKSK